MGIMELFHQEEAHNTRTDFERMAQQPIADTTPQKTSFYTPHTKRQQDVDYEELTKAAQDNYNHGNPKTANVNFQKNGHFPEGTQNFGPGNSSDSKTTPDDDFTANRTQQTNDNETMQALLGTLNSMVTNVKSSSSSREISEPPKFSENDGDWEGWYKLLKSRFKRKGWLGTFLHPIGPGNKDFPNPDFDLKTNTKTHAKLHHLCHGAGLHLRGRYE